MAFSRIRFLKKGKMRLDQKEIFGRDYVAVTPRTHLMISIIGSIIGNSEGRRSVKAFSGRSKRKKILSTFN